ncbi:MAG: hypothetical protein WBX03_12635 [Terriglobales bacterium]
MANNSPQFLQVIAIDSSGEGCRSSLPDHIFERPFAVLLHGWQITQKLACTSY